MRKFHKQGFSKGFTLIELLVVIAIIGILASIILASLATARSKGQDASVQEELANTRSQAELYTGANTAVAGGSCPTTFAALNLFGTSNNGLGNLLGGVQNVISGNFSATNSYCYYGGTTLPSAGGVWVIAVALPSGNGYWCVDYTGNSGTKTSSGVVYSGLQAAGASTKAVNTTAEACN